MDEIGRRDAMKDAPTLWEALLLVAAFALIMAFLGVRTAVTPRQTREAR